MPANWNPNPSLSKKCRQFVISHWGRKGLIAVKDHPVSWVRHEANPELRLLRRKQKGVPLIEVKPTANRLVLQLSTEKGGR